MTSYRFTLEAVGPYCSDDDFSSLRANVGSGVVEGP